MGSAWLLLAFACSGSLSGRTVPTPDDDAHGTPELGLLPDHADRAKGKSHGPDADGDGLSDADEAIHGTDPNKADSDGDGMADGAEISTFKTDPLVADAEFVASGSKAPDLQLPDPPEDRRCKTTGPSAQNNCWVQIPASTFMMGAQASDPAAPNYDPNAGPDEGPVHEVTLDAFWIMRDELSMSLFLSCVTAGTCDEASVKTGGFSTWPGLDEARPDGIALNTLHWEGAQTLCGHLGGRLPTEAEWELAARGTDGRHFPWGNEPGCGVSNTFESSDGIQRDRNGMMVPPCENERIHTPNGLVGQSPYGLVGMAGNVYEWVGDWYAKDAYGDHAAANPRGPSTGTERVQRGGGWTSRDAVDLRSAARMSMPPDAQLNDVGARCVWGTLDD